MNDESSSSNASPGGVEWSPPTLDKVAWLFPQFAIVGMLGRGTVGAVYHGFDAVAERDVVIKILPLEVSQDSGVARIFAKAMPTVVKLAHSHVVAVHEFGLTAEEHLFLVADHVEGSTFRERIGSGQLTPPQTFAIVEQVCDAAHHAHGHGVVHGALHPGNVFLDQHGPVKVADFGMAAFRPPDASLNGASAYLAPEQIKGLHVDHRTDVYSTGVMLYEALTGELPHADSAPASECVAVHPRIDAVIARAMDPSPEARYHSSAELMRAIAAVRSLGAPGANTISIAHAAAVAPAVERRTRRPLWIGVGAAALVLTAAGVIAGTRGKKPTAPRPVNKMPEWPTMATPTPAMVIAKRTEEPKPKSEAKPAPIPKEVPTTAGTWVPVPLDAAKIAGATAVEGGGVHLNKSVKFDRFHAKDVALRATIRLAEDARPAQMWMRSGSSGRVQIVLDGKPSCFLQTTLKDNKFRSFGVVSAPWVQVGDRWVTVECAAIGDKLFGAVNGRAITVTEASDVLEPGIVGIYSSDADIKDLSVMILDDVPPELYPEFIKTALAPVVAKVTPEPVPEPAPPTAEMPPPAPEPPKTSPEVVTWLAKVGEPFQEKYQREVAGPFDGALAVLRKNFLGTVDAQIAETSRAAKLEEAVAWRKERQRFFESGQNMPADDSDNPGPTIKPMRATFRAGFAKIDRERFARSRTQFVPYDAVLAQNQAALTQRQRLDDALLVKSRREELAKIWLAPPASAPPVAAKPIVSKTMTAPEPARQGLRETVSWLLANGTELTVEDGKKWRPVIDVRLLPTGTPAFKVRIDTAKFQTPPTVEQMQKLGSLRTVTTFESNTRLGDEAWTFLRELGGVERLQIPGDKLTDAVVNYFASLSSLKTLHLQHGANWTGKTMGQLSKLSSLRNLDVEYSGLDDEGAAAVSSITSLEELQLRKTKVTDAGMVHLAKLRNLRRLGLNETAVTLDGLAALKGLKNLESIGFLSADLPDYAGAVQKMAVLFPRLLSTRVQGTPLGKEHFAPLASWRSLTHLVVRDSELREGATAGIAQIGSLEWLEITNTAFGDIDVDGLLGMKSLKRLTLNGTKLSDRGLLKLRALKELKEVNVTSTPVTPEGARALEREKSGCKVTR